MPQHVYARSSSDNEQVIQLSETEQSPGAEDLDTTDDEFMQMAAQAHTETHTFFTEDPDPRQQGELT